MDKRAMAILLLSAVGFLVATILFFSTVDKIQIVGNETFLGETQSEVLDTFLDGEGLMVYLETAARVTARNGKFNEDFPSYIVKANTLFGADIKFEDYTVSEGENFVKAVSSKDVVFMKGGLRYSITPSFFVTF